MGESRSFALKLARASEHLKIVEGEIAGWVYGNPYLISDEPDPDASNPSNLSCSENAVRRRFRVARIDPVSPWIGPVIGDCLFNLRSALDHLALSLALAYTPVLTDKQRRDSTFPILRKPLSDKDESEKIGGIHPGAQASIRAFQPYQRPQDLKSHPLWWLNELNRVDKHQTLAVCAAVPMLLRARRKGETGFGVSTVVNALHGSFQTLDYASTTLGELKTDAVFFRYAGVPLIAVEHINPNPKIPLDVAFGHGQPVELELVVPVLEAIYNFISDRVVPALTQFL